MSLTGKARELVDAFPLGLIVLVMIVLSGASAPFLLLRNRAGPATLEVWCFARLHTDAYEKMLPRFRRQYPDVDVKIELIQYDALHRRLNACFQTDVGAPDIVEVEISGVGPFFTGPLDEVGFVDLTDRLRRTGLYDQFLEAKFRAWSSRGRIFGLPRDVSPAVLAYNKAEFDKAGIDPNTIDTWDDFIQAVKPLAADNDGDGEPDRLAIELTDTRADHFRQLLYQRGYDLFDARGDVLIDSKECADTLAFYLKMIRGPDRIGGYYPWGGVLTQAMHDHRVLSFITPDWRTGMFKQDAPVMRGRLRLAPLPRWKDGRRRVTTWGGTMIAICKSSKNIDLAWEFLKFFYSNPEELLTVYEQTGIIPPIKTLWSDAIFRKPDPFFGGQPIGTIYTKLAPQTPAVYKTAFSNLTEKKVDDVLARAARRCETEGIENAPQIAREELARAARDVRRLIARNPFH